MAKVFEVDSISDIEDYFDVHETGIKDGDIIEHFMHPGYGYRNNGKFIWWNGKVCELGTEIDDYGNVPKFVKITDTNGLTPHHWVKSINHNAYIWFSDEIINRINFTQKECKVIIGGTEYTFEYAGIHTVAPDPKSLYFWTYDMSNTVYYANF